MSARPGTAIAVQVMSFYANGEFHDILSYSLNRTWDSREYPTMREFVMAVTLHALANMMPEGYFITSAFTGIHRNGDLFEEVSVPVMLHKTREKK